MILDYHVMFCLIYLWSATSDKMGLEVEPFQSQIGGTFDFTLSDVAD